MRLPTPRAGAALAAALAILGSACGANEPAGPAAPLWTAPAEAVRLDAHVRFTGTQFVIENRGSQLWRDVEVHVGLERDPPAYRYGADATLGGRSLTIGALNFERPDGTRLSPFRLQPDRWAIVAVLPDGRRGFAEGVLR